MSATSTPDPSLEYERLRRERDLYRRLLALGQVERLEPFLDEALALITEASGARQGYLELRAEDGDEEPSWWSAGGFSETELTAVRAALSRGIVAEAIAGGATIVTPSALLDPRFRARMSVRRHRIGPVLCTPIGGDPALGVVYLQGRTLPGAFDEEDRARAELFARHIGPLAERVRLYHRARELPDPTEALRARLRLDGVIGHSPALAEVLRQAALVAPLDVNVLITGESGTGKSQLARVIHDNGPRACGPFVELNCAALPEALVEQELFGARPGAHSTAEHAIPGKVAAAQGGTLLLDEIGDLPLAAQAKLLHLLQNRQFYPLGASRPEHADVRLLAATHNDLEEAVRARRFREDLFYRLGVLPIRMPGLAERRDDVGALARWFCARACERHRLARLELSAGALRALATAGWPGHVRQLAHVVEAGAIRAAGEGVLRVERCHLFPCGTRAHGGASAEPPTFQEATRRFQRELLVGTLEHTRWNVAGAARRLGLARSHVYNLIKCFGLERDAR